MDEISESRKRGRPRVDSTNIGVRLPPDQVAALDKWIKRHPEPKPSRPEAIRQILSERLTEAGCLPKRRDLRPSRQP